MSQSTQPKLAVDAVIFTVKEGKLHALLIQMKKAPHTGKWAFPGGLLDMSETTQQAAVRILTESTGVKDVYLEQLKTFDAIDRDPTGRVVSVAYFALIPNEGIDLKTSEKYSDVRWWPVKKLPDLAYDHKAVVKEAITRVKNRLEYTNIVWSLLPKTFTLSELQNMYEVILGKELDKRNFRKKILSLGLLKATGKKRASGAHRPAALYQFKQRTLEYVGIM